MLTRPHKEQCRAVWRTQSHPLCYVFLWKVIGPVRFLNSENEQRINNRTKEVFTRANRSKNIVLRLVAIPGRHSRITGTDRDLAVHDFIVLSQLPQVMESRLADKAPISGPFLARMWVACFAPLSASDHDTLKQICLPTNVTPRPRCAPLTYFHNGLANS